MLNMVCPSPSGAQKNLLVISGKSPYHEQLLEIYAIYTQKISFQRWISTNFLGQSFYIFVSQENTRT